jgi:hypothetical protein
MDSRSKTQRKLGYESYKVMRSTKYEFSLYVSLSPNTAI